MNKLAIGGVVIGGAILFETVRELVVVVRQNERLDEENTRLIEKYNRLTDAANYYLTIIWREENTAFDYFDAIAISELRDRIDSV